MGRDAILGLSQKIGQIRLSVDTRVSPAEGKNGSCVAARSLQSPK